MVQRTQDTVITLMVLKRFVLLLATILIAILTIKPFEILLVNYLQYNPPCTSFFCFPELALGILSIMLSLMFWAGVFFGLMGKKGDYVLIGLLLVPALYLFYVDVNIPGILTLLGVSLAGNLIGFLLKKGFKRS